MDRCKSIEQVKIIKKPSPEVMFDLTLYNLSRCSSKRASWTGANQSTHLEMRILTLRESILVALSPTAHRGEVLLERVPVAPC